MTLFAVAADYIKAAGLRMIAPAPCNGMSKHKELLKEFGYVAQSARTVDALMEAIVQRLHDAMTLYNWVGFYLLDKDRPGSLALGPHVGSFEPHESISLDKGLCGAAATTKKTVVVPVFTQNGLYGEIDINSYFADTFNFDEQKFVEACAELVSSYLEKPR